MFVHALSGAASFAACLRLFRSYPLAVSPWSGDGRQRSIVLRHPGIEADRAGGGSGFFVLTQDQAKAVIDTLRIANVYDLRFAWYFTSRLFADVIGQGQAVRNDTTLYPAGTVPRTGTFATQWLIGYQYFGGFTGWTPPTGTITGTHSPVKLSRALPYWNPCVHCVQLRAV